jgi:hypothetical protein
MYQTELNEMSIKIVIKHLCKIPSRLILITRLFSLVFSAIWVVILTLYRIENFEIHSSRAPFAKECVTGKPFDASRMN